jgi:hypothetical protein
MYKHIALLQAMVEEFLGDFLAILEMVSKVLKAELEMA